MFREQEKLELLKRLRQSVSVPWAGFYTEGGSWARWRSTTTLIVTSICACPELRLEGTNP